MKFRSILTLSFLGYGFVQAYDNCSTCRVVTVEDGIQWGVENNDWCGKFRIIIYEIIKKNKNKIKWNVNLKNYLY